MADYYWKGGVDTESQTAGNWVTTSEGSTAHTTIPGSDDDLFFDVTATRNCVFTSDTVTYNSMEIGEEFAHYITINDTTITITKDSGSSYANAGQLIISGAKKIICETASTFIFTSSTNGAGVEYGSNSEIDEKLGVFYNDESRQQMTFHFNYGTLTTLVLGEGVYPNIQLTNAKFSPVTSTVSNQYEEVKMLGFTVYSSSSVEPHTSISSTDLTKIYRIEGDIVCSSNTFKWGKSILKLAPVTAGEPFPYDGNIASFGSGTPKVFNAEYYDLRIIPLLNQSTNYFSVTAGAIISVNSFTVESSGRIYGPSTGSSAEVHTLKKPTVRGDWNFQRISDGVYRSITKKPLLDIPHGGTGLSSIGEAGRVLAVHSSGEYLEWSATAGGTSRTVTVDTDGDGSADATLGASETLMLQKGSNVTLAESSGVVTISSTDTNTTYGVGNGIGLSGTTFFVSAGNGLAQTGNGLQIADPATLNQLTESTDSNFDKFLLWDESTSTWKYMLLADLQDSIDTNTNQLTTFDIGVDTNTNATTISHGETLTFTGGTGISTETTADGTVTITNDSPNVFSGSIAATQVAYGSGTNAITGESDFTYDATNNLLTVDKVKSHIIIEVQNDTGSSIPKGQAVYVDAEGTHPSVAPALATNAAKMPSIGLAQEALATSGVGYVCVNGIITISTSVIDDTLSDPGDVGKTLYVSETTAGNLTITKPTSPNDLVQNVGKIADINGTNVKVIVSNIGRSNDVPNTISIEGDITTTTGDLTVSAGQASFTIDDATNVPLRVEQDGDGRIAEFYGASNEVVHINKSGSINFNLSTAGGDSDEQIFSYRDSGSTARNFLSIDSGTVVLHNRASDGDVEIRANTSTAGSSGEVTVAQFQDSIIDLKVPTTLTSTESDQLKINYDGDDKFALHVGTDRTKFRYADTGGTLKDVLTFKENGTSVPRVGVNQNDPDTAFHVGGNIKSTSSSSPTLYVGTTATSSQQANLTLHGARNAENTIGQITFSNIDSTDDPDVTYDAARIVAFNDGGLNAGGLYFQTVPSGSSTTLATALTIQEDTNIVTAGNLTVGGNLIVSGDSITVNAETITTEEAMLSLGIGQTATDADALDFGFYGTYDVSDTQKYRGLFADASDSGKFKLFKDLETEPTTTVDTSGTGYAVGTLVANLEGNVTGNVSGTAATVTDATQSAITSVGTLTSLAISGDLTVDTSTLKVDSTNNRVGIGNASPSAPLTVTADTDGGDTVRIEGVDANGNLSTPDLTLIRTNGSPGANTYLGHLHFKGMNNASGTNEEITYASIAGQIDSGIDGSEKGRMKFFTYVNGTTTNTMTIDEANVGIGTTSPDSPLHINVNDDDELEWIAELRNTPNPQAPTSFGAGIKLALSSGSGNELLKWAGMAAVKSPDLNYSRKVDAVFYTQTDAGNGVAPTEKMRITGDGKVGIGLTNPAAKLTVDDSILVSSSGDTADPKTEGILQRITGTTDDNPSMEIFFVENQGLNYGFRMHYDGTNNRMRFFTHDNNTSGSEVMRFNRAAAGDIWLGPSGSKVMIGSTSSPTFPLHLKYTDNRTDPEGSGSSTGAGAIGADAEGGGLYIENLSTTDGSFASITFRTDTADGRIAYQSVGSSLVNEGQMSFYCDANDSPNQYTLEEVLRLRGGGSGAAQTFNSAYINGRLGIGTSSPDDILHVKGTDAALLVEDAGADSNPAVEIKNDAVHWKLQARGGDSDKFRIVEGSNTHAVIDTSGNVGIGTTAPSTDLHVAQPGDTSDHYTALTLDNGIDTDGGRGVGMDFRVRFGSSNIHTSQIYFDFYGDKWTDSIGMNYVSGRSGSFSHHHFRDQAGATQLMIADSGNVGIGSGFTHAAQPGSTLDVVAAGTTGHGLKVYRNQSSSNMDSALVYLHDDSQYADEAVLHVKQDGTGVGILVDGSLQATTKSFDIEHPTKEGMRLHHGSLEGPEHGVYIRGKNNSGTIHLPDYWKGLVDKDTITVQLTAIGKPQELYVREIKNNRVRVAAKTRGTHLNYFYFIQAERKDVEKMVVEY